MAGTIFAMNLTYFNKYNLFPVIHREAMRTLLFTTTLFLSLLSASAQQKKPAQEATDLDKRAWEVYMHHSSNQDTITKALKLLDKAIDLDHNCTSAYGKKINILKENRRYNECLNTLDEAIKYHPQRHDFYLMKGAVLEKLNRIDESSAIYKKALELCESRLKENPTVGTFIDSYFLKYCVYRTDIPNSEVIAAIPSSFTEDERKQVIGFMDMIGSIRQYQPKFVEKATDRQNDIQMLKSFYTQYISNILENKDKANDALMKEYFLPTLIEEIKETNQRLGADNVIRAQDATKEMLNTLEIKPLESDYWYMVSYKTVWHHTEIPVKVTYRNEKCFIEHIVPEVVESK